MRGVWMPYVYVVKLKNVPGGGGWCVDECVGQIL